jgi:hypothetical protein
VLKKSLFLSLLTGTCLSIPHFALALNGPSAIEIDGGPLGPLELSGGLDGFAFFQTGTGRESSIGNKSTGTELGDIVIDVKKTKGIINYEVQIADYNFYVLGVGTPGQANANHLTTGPLHKATVTLNFTDNFNISAGVLPSLEGYEATFPWYNSVGLDTVLFFVENAASRGVSANYTCGPVNLTATFGDGNDTGVFNYLQFLATYNFNSNNNLNIFGGIQLGKTGPNAFAYGGGTTGGEGLYFVDNNVFGAYYSTTIGNLSLTPEVQYQYAQAYHKYAASGNDIPKTTSNFGVALFGQYNFGTSPYSLGGWAEYASSKGSSATWFIAPNAQLVGFAIAPTWQHKDIYLRANAGYLHLLNGTGSYGDSGTGKNMMIGTLETGLVF